MYKCCNCKRVFDEPIEQYEYSEYWGVPGTTGFYVSPCCKEAFIESNGSDGERFVSEYDRYMDDLCDCRRDESEEMYAF